MKYLFSLILIFFVTACSDSTRTLNLPALEAKPEVLQLVKDSWGKVLQRCPGLPKYQDDLLVTGINDWIEPIMGKMSRAELVVEVSDRPDDIPDSFRVYGHTCGYGISPNGNSLRIQKSVCVSLCLDEKYEGSTDYVSPL